MKEKKLVSMYDYYKYVRTQINVNGVDTAVPTSFLRICFIRILYVLP